MVDSIFGEEPEIPSRKPESDINPRIESDIEPTFEVNPPNSKVRSESYFPPSMLLLIHHSRSPL